MFKAVIGKRPQSWQTVVDLTTTGPCSVPRRNLGPLAFHGCRVPSSESVVVQCVWQRWDLRSSAYATDSRDSSALLKWLPKFRPVIKPGESFISGWRGPS
jgi:hypothetical protein